jgi:hypothetical protein
MKTVVVSQIVKELMLGMVISAKIMIWLSFSLNL